MKQEKLTCPRCEQDYLVFVMITPLQQNAFICPECDALWPVPLQAYWGNFIDYATYMESRGHSGLWDYLVKQ